MATPPAADSAALPRRLRTEWRVITLLLALLSALPALWDDVPGARPVDRLSYDAAMRLVAHPRASPDIVIVAIDDASIDALGYWPWRRALHARLLERLQHARIVGLDLVLAEPQHAHEGDDEALARAIARHGRVVLPEVLSPEGRHRIAPMPLFASAAAGIGRIDAEPDSDGVLRAIMLRRSPGPGEVPLPHFSLTLSMLAGDEDAALRSLDIPPDARSRIRYIDPAYGYAVHPYSAVLDGTIPASRFAGKTVLVGAWASGLGDRLPTAMARGLQPGVEILAHSIQNLREELWIRIMPRWATALLSALVTIVMSLGLRRLSPRWGLAYVAGWIVLWLLADALLMQWAGYWVAPAGAIFAIALSYPLWNWRSQEASLHHIDLELERLQGGSDDRGGDRPPAPYGTLPDRVSRLHRAISDLKRAHKRQEETLSFLSHDMRSPQSTILAAVALRRERPDEWGESETLAHIERQALSTQALVEDFVQWTRVQSAPLMRQPCVLEDLIQDACDRRWPVAQARQVTVVFQPSPDTTIVQADTGLLSRAIGNLLDNAITYSPQGGEVLCTLHADGTAWALRIRDAGPGIPPSQLPHVFTAFWRAPGSGAQVAGSGLGLAFVRMVVQRHGGDVSCDSEPGRGTVFTVRLPRFPERLA